MKWFKYCFLLILFIPVMVFSKNKMVVFEEYSNNLYYNERYSSPDDFIQEVTISSGKTYTQSFLLNNRSHLKKDIFLLFESRGEDGSYDDLLEYLNLRILINDKVVYEGSGEIANYATKSEDLYDFISIGKIPEKEDSTLQIEMTIKDEYQELSNNQYAYVEWSFYTQDKNKEYVEVKSISPGTLYNFLEVWVFIGVCLLFSLLLLGLFLYKNRKTYKHKDKKEKKKKEKEESKK